MLTYEPRICAVQVLPFNPARTLGGAEAMAVELLNALSACAHVDVLHGVGPNDLPGVRRIPGISGEVHGAFPLSEDVCERGHIRPQFSDAARRLLDSADIIVSIERSLDLSSKARRIVTLGGVGYPHTLDVLAHGAWEKLVVPSPFVAEQIAERAPQASGIQVLVNGLDTALFSPIRSEQPPTGSVRLLVASRPSWDKGFLRAFELAGAMQRQGIDTEILCFSQPDGFGPSDFTARLQAAASDLRLKILPWRLRNEMPSVYRTAHLTLCLGDAEEGFGLVAAESIATGTPVLASPVGFLARMLPPSHGMFLLDFDTTPIQQVKMVELALERGREVCRSLGRPYIIEHYGIQRMRREIVRIVEEITC